MRLPSGARSASAPASRHKERRSFGCFCLLTSFGPPFSPNTYDPLYGRPNSQTSPDYEQVRNPMMKSPLLRLPQLHDPLGSVCDKSIDDPASDSESMETSFHPSSESKKDTRSACSLPNSKSMDWLDQYHSHWSGIHQGSNDGILSLF